MNPSAASPPSLAAPEGLEALRDVSLPAPIAWWPPAPGWWAAAGATVVVALAGYALWRRWRRARYRREALAILQQAATRYRARGDDAELVAELSALLRRFAMSEASGDGRRIAGLTDEAWLSYLDRLAESRAFTHGPGRILARGPYQPPDALAADGEQLIRLAETVIRRGRRRRR